VYNEDLAMMDWRRQTSQLYTRVRAETDPAAGHALWRAGRDDMFRNHPQSPLLPGDPLLITGIHYWPYDPTMRFELELIAADEPKLVALSTSSTVTLPLRLLGKVRLPEPLGFDIDIWRLQQYGGGLFVPLRDGTAGTSTYTGGRYVLDTVKGADLGGSDSMVILDFNFAYHPSCHYNPEWVSPLAPPGNSTEVPIEAGERIAATA
jgi:uncharacterized protein (DUF1684 family)